MENHSPYRCTSNSNKAMFHHNQHESFGMGMEKRLCKAVSNPDVSKASDLIVLVLRRMNLSTQVRFEGTRICMRCN